MKMPDTPSDMAVDAANQLHRSAMKLFRVIRTGRPAKGLSLVRFGLLGRLYRDGSATATDLSAYLRIKPQSLTRLIADLEQEGFITRHASDEDRRQNMLEITHAGARVLMEDVRSQRDGLAQVIEKELTPAEQELLRIAAGLMDRVAEKAEAFRTQPES